MFYTVIRTEKALKGLNLHSLWQTWEPFGYSIAPIEQDRGEEGWNTTRRAMSRSEETI